MGLIRWGNLEEMMLALGMEWICLVSELLPIVATFFSEKNIRMINMAAPFTRIKIAPRQSLLIDSIRRYK